MMREMVQDGGSELDELSADQVLELLGQYQRREILRQLRDSPGQNHSIDDLVAYLQSIERRRTTPIPGDNHLLSVIVHIHGPKLEEAGLVDIDTPSGQLRYHPNERVEEMLDYIDEWAAEY